MTIHRDVFCTITVREHRLFVLTRAIGRLVVSITVLLLLVQHASAQDNFRPADTFFSQSYLAEIGRTVVSPAGQTRVSAAGQAGAEVSSCRATCDAFVPRQPVLTVEWENQAAGTGPTPSATGADTRIRLDISGTPSGFAEGNYSTIRLSNIPTVDAVVLDPASPIPAPGGEVLLNRVASNRIVERSSALPVFDTPDVMARSLSNLPQDVRGAVEADQRTGALGQVRVVGRASTPLRGESQQIVTMVGLQPGTTYRLRLVEEQQGGAESIFEQICRIPVCPADFVTPGQ